MEITKTRDGGKLTVAVAGRLDTTTAPQLESSLNEDIDTATELVFDFADLEYISSAGLRVLLATQKVMNKQGKMIILHANNEIKEVFDITGFSDILTLQD